MEQSENINELASAINEAQLRLNPVTKGSDNPFFHSRYADLAAVWEGLLPFREVGIAITQSPADAPIGHLALETQLTHGASGQWMRSRLVLPLAKCDPQGAGSAITYARRYALGCMTGLVTESDDDGNAASAPVRQPQRVAVPALEVQSPYNTAPELLWEIGKYKGSQLSEITFDYLTWFIREGNNHSHVQMATEELERRNHHKELV